jgi:hypothetical protein
VAHRSLRATIGAMASCYFFPENNSSETHCGGSKKPNQLKIKWGLDGTTINCLFET